MTVISAACLMRLLKLLAIQVNGSLSKSAGGGGGGGGQTGIT